MIDIGTRRRTRDELRRLADRLDSTSKQLSHCKECELPLPLLKPTPGSNSVIGFTCSGCGALYKGILDMDAPIDVILNVRPAICSGNGLG